MNKTEFCKYICLKKQLTTYKHIKIVELYTHLNKENSNKQNEKNLIFTFFLAVQTMDLPFGLQIPNCEVWNKEVEFDRSEIAIM